MNAMMRRDRQRDGRQAAWRGQPAPCRRAFPSWAAGVFALAAMLGGPATSAAEQPDPRIAIELNRLQDLDGTCRLSFVFTNKLPDSVAALSIETVLFNAHGQVERLLVLKSRPLSPGKIRAQQFDVPGTACAGIGRVLVNDVTECKAGALTPADCLDRLAPTSRADVPFVSTD